MSTRNGRNKMEITRKLGLSSPLVHLGAFASDVDYRDSQNESAAECIQGEVLKTMV